MAPGTHASLGGVAQDDLIALTEEMAALVRAGVPLEAGLARAAVDLSRRPAEIASTISRRMQHGESLAHIMDSSPDTFPPAYRAVVEAGLRSGRLPAALEGLASSSRRVAELRRLTRASLIYPLFVALAAYGLLVYGIVAFQPKITEMYGAMDEPPSQFNLLLADFGRTAFTWLPWIPVVVLVLVAVWWYRSTRATARDPGLLPFSPASRMLHYARISTFADMLALLVENGTPLPQAIVLASDASGDQHLQSTARTLAAGLEGGAKAEGGRGKAEEKQKAEGRRQKEETIAVQSSPSSIPHSPLPTPHSASQSDGFPPLLRWLLSGGSSPQVLVESLRNTAEAYRRRAMRLDDWLRLAIPIGLTIGIAGTAVIVYALCTLGPWYQMLTHIATPAK